MAETEPDAGRIGEAFQRLTKEPIGESAGASGLARPPSVGENRRPGVPARLPA